MRIAFYYHIPVFIEEGRIKAPSYFGVFIDALAKHVTHLYIILHESKEVDKSKGEYFLRETNITWINLGKKTPAWHRALHHEKILKNSLAQIETCEALLIRSPSPLAPFFKRYLKNPKVYFMIVGDYVEGLKNMKERGVRSFIVKAFLIYIDWLFKRSIKGSSIIVNSPALLKKYENSAKDVRVIKTTSISDSDFFYRLDTCQESRIQILYTGRLDPAKGLFELIEAVSSLRRKGLDIMCNIVGAVEKVAKGESTIKEDLIVWSQKLKIEEFVIFHGWKSLGEELNLMYRTSDIYVIPSFHEGFPRTIWEAMANAIPVIATNVGAIPYYLKDGESAIIIEPKDSKKIEMAILNLIHNKALREKLIQNGLHLAKEVTQEKQMELLINSLKDFKNVHNEYGKVY